MTEIALHALLTTALDPFLPLFAAIAAVTRAGSIYQILRKVVRKTPEPRTFGLASGWTLGNLVIGCIDPPQQVENVFPSRFVIAWSRGGISYGLVIREVSGLVGCLTGGRRRRGTR